jgi:hypothetical protein
MGFILYTKVRANNVIVDGGDAGLPESVSEKLTTVNNAIVEIVRAMPIEENLVTWLPAGYVTDGTVDYSAYLTEMLDEGVKRVHIPADFTFNAGTTSFTIPSTVVLDMHPTSAWRYNGTGVALTIEGAAIGSADEFRGGHHSLGTIHRNAYTTNPEWATGVDTSSVGLRVKNVKMNTIFIAGMRNFYRGIQLASDEDNCVFNTFELGYIRNCMRGVSATNNGAGGANSNVFTGGEIRVDSAYQAYAGGVKLVEWSGAEQNANIFYGVGLEASGSTMKIIDSNSPFNQFIGVRTEGAGAASITFGALATSNLVVTTSALAFGSTIVSDGGGASSANVVRGTVGEFGRYGGFDHSLGQLRIGNAYGVESGFISYIGANRLRYYTNDGGHRFDGLVYFDTPQDLLTSATPTVRRNVVNFSFSGATTVTNFAGLIDAAALGGRFVGLATNGNCTIENNANIITGTGGNVTMTSGRLYEFVGINGVWYMSRLPAGDGTD